MQDIENRIRDLISQHINISKEEINLESSLGYDLGVDSLDAVEIIMALEEEYSIEIPDEDADQMVKVKDLVEYINDKLSKQVGEPHGRIESSRD